MENKILNLRSSIIRSKPDKIDIIAIITIVIIIVMVIIYFATYSNNKTIKGFWEVSKTYCDDSGLNDMNIYFGDSDGFHIFGNDMRYGYLVISYDTENVETILFKMNMKKMQFYNNIKKLSNYTYYDVDFTDENGKEIELPFPSNLILMYNPDKIVLQKNKTIYGIFYKNNEVLDEENLGMECVKL